jgi:hypothetical protein
MDMNLAKTILLGLLGMAYSARSLRLYAYSKSKMDLFGVFLGIGILIFSIIQ